jgi:hypothetical protein
MRGLVLCSAVAAWALATAVGDPAEAATCTPVRHLTSSAYHVRLCGFPDYDQRRISATSVGAAKFDFVGLPGDGSCHCVPTAFTNVLGYYAVKGAAVKPAPFAWDARSLSGQFEPGLNGVTPASYNTTGYSGAEHAAYESVSAIDSLLGTAAGVEFSGGACGTNFGSLANAANLLMPLLSQQTQFSYTLSGVDEGTPRDMATAMALGATVLVAYGRYDDVKILPPDGGLYVTGARSGGHVMTLRGVKNTSGGAVISLRDPADDENSQTAVQDRIRQSAFMTTFANLKRVTGSFAGKFATLWQLDDVAANATGRFLDGWMAIWPDYVATVDGQNISITGFNYNFLSPTRTPAAPVKRSTTRRYALRGTIDATIIPRTGELAFKRRGRASIQAINLATGGRRTLGKAPAATRDLEVDARRGDVLALGARQLVRIDPTTRKRVARTLPAVFDALAYDPANDRVALVSAAKSSLRVLDAAQLDDPTVLTLPASATRGAGRLAIAFDRSGRLLLQRQGVRAIRRVVITADKTSPGPMTVLRAGTLGTGLVTTDHDTTLANVGGRLVEIRENGSTVKNSPFAHGRPGAGRLVSIIHAAIDQVPQLVGQTIDMRVDNDPSYPELATSLPPAGSHGLEVLTDSAADQRMNAAR